MYGSWKQDSNQSGSSSPCFDIGRRFTKTAIHPPRKKTDPIQAGYALMLNQGYQMPGQDGQDEKATIDTDSRVCTSPLTPTVA